MKIRQKNSGIQKRISIIDDLKAMNQTIGKANIFHLPHCIGFIEYEKAFDTIENLVTFETVRNIEIHETYIKIYAKAPGIKHIEGYVNNIGKHTNEKR